MNSGLYPALYAPTDGYVFVVTYGRSGSTLTQSLLNSIPGYCIRGENGNIPYFLARAASITNSWDNYVWRRADKIKPASEQKPFLKGIIGTPSDPWYGAENTDPTHFCKSLMDVFARDILRIPEGTKVAGFKEIRFHEDAKFFHSYMQTLRDHFPNARFIFQTRNAEHVANSSWWGSRPRETVLEMVNMADSLFREFSLNNEGICYTVQYEKYAEGYGYVLDLCDFLKEAPNKEAIESVLCKRLRH
ncbi:sulfotransferase (plasmid) [Paracoccus methylovorus]|uniref:Sulfotransferase n=1 Tax=Paracoccus methylovorus TaxID=2812658 RepID=A0ABX7JNE2_9RHOB|nr:sulfotransferase [Paracoccus methylovorus]QRZ14469.1 sulfotransferase [Paracoccus methylovorus]